MIIDRNRGLKLLKAFPLKHVKHGFMWVSSLPFASSEDDTLDNCHPLKTLRDEAISPFPRILGRSPEACTLSISHIF
jgi:hypothetical protein